jgi:UDP-N-acetylglucosamine--N-acetylmuramyl-(pentapeptide) pyrophosphoryl-undecaprenol N-acetylglucosamine transferase
MKIIFVGGGTMGSVSPLVGLYEGLKEKESQLEVLWLGTKKGPEKNFLAQYDITYKPIIGGKLRQYFSLANLLTPCLVLFGFIQAIFILRKFKPDVILTAGSFIAVPVVYAASFLKIPSFIHQQDLEKGLANKLMQKTATAITVSFQESLEIFPAKKTYWTGNPVRKAVLSGDKQKGLEFFKLDPAIDTVLIFGGGQGAQTINQMVLETIADLTKNYQVIHLTGKDKSISGRFFNYYDRQTRKRIESRYRDYEFLNEEIFDAYAVASLVVCRAGFSTLTELSVLAQPALLIPIPGHQTKNARYFAKYNAVKILPQEQLDSETFLKMISSLMENPADRQQLSRNISSIMDGQATQKYIDLIYRVLEKNNK